MSPVLWRVALEHLLKAPSLHLLGDFDASEVENRGGDVDIHGHAGGHDPRRNKPRIPNQQRDSVRRLVHETLVVPAVFAEEVAVVGGVDDQGVFGHPGGVEILENAPEVLVDANNSAVVVLDETLEDPVTPLLGV